MPLVCVPLGFISRIRYPPIQRRKHAEDGHAGCEVRVTPITTEIIIRATKTRNVVGESKQRIRELTCTHTENIQT